MKQRVMKDKGLSYPAWVLDRAGIDVTLVNADALGPGQVAPRFHWVPFADAFLYPFGKRSGTLARLLKEAGAGERVPPSFQLSSPAASATGSPAISTVSRRSRGSRHSP